MERITNQTDARPPREIAALVQRVGLTKAKAPVAQFLLLAVLAGAFISMGALFFAVLITDSQLGFGVTRLIGGIGFSLGLILVIVAGAELFTGNNLIAMAWASRQINTSQLIRSWVVAYLGNVIGCLLTIALVLLADIAELGNRGVGESLVAIAKSKSELTWSAVLARGILCNALVCMAVWLAMAGRGVADKILAIVFPISAFVVMGFEHSIANWFFLPLGMILDQGNTITMMGLANNLALSTLGNLLGGTILVAGIYWLAYLHQSD